MLGTLAKWLRILGYDTVYDNRIDDDEIVERCVREGRIALTRDARLTERRLLRSALLIESTELGAQLRQVLSYLGRDIDPARLLSRCLQCNGLLQPISPEAVQALVPEYVFRTQREFKQCPSCCRVYWGGTHRHAIRRRLRKLLSWTDKT
jgi:uncharacterized protein with PIN domain